MLSLEDNIVPYKDKEKQKEAQQKHYLNNKNKFKERLKVRRIERCQWFNEYKEKQNFQCIDCNESHPSCICFHHRNPDEKLATIANLVCQPASQEIILAEIDKCDVLCHNCHVKHHWQIETRIFKEATNLLQKRRIDSSVWFFEYKKQHNFKCLNCNENNPICLCFHHREPNEKICDVSHMVTFAYSKKKILAEIAKCDVLCQNCHSKHHWNTDFRRRNIIMGS